MVPTGLNPPPPTPSQPHTVFIYCTVTHGGGGEPERRLWGSNSSQNWVENTNMTDRISTIQSINSNRNLPHSPFTGKIF
jgi:hypothetical protein